MSKPCFEMSFFVCWEQRPICLNRKQTASCSESHKPPNYSASQCIAYVYAVDTQCNFSGWAWIKCTYPRFSCCCKCQVKTKVYTHYIYVCFFIKLVTSLLLRLYSLFHVNYLLKKSGKRLARVDMDFHWGVYSLVVYWAFCGAISVF